MMLYLALREGEVHSDLDSKAPEDIYSVARLISDI